MPVEKNKQRYPVELQGKPRDFSNLHNKNSQTGPNDLFILFLFSFIVVILFLA